MFSHYQMTILEEFLESTYAAAGIIYPHQISVEELSLRLNVWVHYRPIGSRALEATSGMYSMFLDERLPPNQQRLDFLHELCHLLRHAGNQMVLPETFTQMQENEAEHFVLYAAMPFSMISRLEVPDRLGQAKLFLAETFGVPIELAEQRLDQLQRRTLQGIWNEVVNGQFRENRMKKPLWSPETNKILKQLNRQLIAKGLPGYQDKGLLQ
ncbi:ImmA/IrrE family metallo-endopeptidase [Paenibacillus sp. 3LSP]|uniref:ImmA/IrrE family metallo-endopeptidase n=1 Tax=Paenibacillus sp. 3LSP TaxID=2800795 RepID=UPI0028FDA649|nr:ImmA/IrrE family metallo-endopeptidase [Paenibacillus sp. 3LSP]MDU0332573.1 ImmA/IrrE family metallo-endopeptidase [Paenibacillus sp. 3LSP]